MPKNQCRHIHTSGHRCGSPALRQQAFCYFHHTTRSPIPEPELRRRRGHRAILGVPSLEDRAGIQLALTEVLRRIADHDLDPRRAGLLLYGLQIASSNLPKPAAQPTPTVEDVIEDETQGLLAPEKELRTPPTGEELADRFLERWQQSEDAAQARRAQKRQTKRVPHDQANEESVIVGEIPPKSGITLQACTAQAPRTLRLPLRPLRSGLSRRQARHPNPRSTPNPNQSKILRKITGGGIPLGTRTRKEAQRPTSAYSSAALEGPDHPRR